MPVPPVLSPPLAPLVNSSAFLDTGINGGSPIEDGEMLAVLTSNRKDGIHTGALAARDSVQDLHGHHNNDEDIQDSDSSGYSRTDENTVGGWRDDKMDLSLINLDPIGHSQSVVPPYDIVPLTGTPKRFPGFEWSYFSSLPGEGDEATHDTYIAKKILEWFPGDAVGEVLGDGDSKGDTPPTLEDLSQLPRSSRKRPRTSNDGHPAKNPAITNTDEKSQKRMRLYPDQTCLPRLCQGTPS